MTFRARLSLSGSHRSPFLQPLEAARPTRNRRTHCLVQAGSTCSLRRPRMHAASPRDEASRVRLWIIWLACTGVFPSVGPLDPEYQAARVAVIMLRATLDGV